MPVTPAAPRLMHAAYLPLVIGAVSLETLAAFEDRAVGTALPTVARHFHALASFGLTYAAPAASYLVVLGVAGVWADRRGPGQALRVGTTLFVLAQVLVGGALDMPMVVLGRLISGIAESLLDVSLMVVIAHALPADLRSRVVALFSTMWILPSVFGPPVAGAVAQYIGWRWIFLGAAALAVPAWLALRPALRRLSVPDQPSGTVPVAAMLASAGAAAAVLALTLTGARLRLLPLSAVAIAMLLACAVKLLPTGTFRLARGIPAIIVLRAVLGAAFSATGGYLPLLLTEVRGYPPTTAGVTLSITGVCWAAGSWLQGRQRAASRVIHLRWGLAALTAGLAGTTLLADNALPVWIGLVSWAIAGLGMGLSISTLSVLTMDQAPPGAQGRTSGTAQSARSLAVAVAFAAGGTVLAAAGATPAPAVFAALVAAAAVIAAAGLVIAGRARA